VPGPGGDNDGPCPAGRGRKYSALLVQLTGLGKRISTLGTRRVVSLKSGARTGTPKVDKQPTLTSRVIVHAFAVVALMGSVLGLRAGPATATPTITFDGSVGTNAPPPTLGPYQMTAFGDDTRPACTAGPSGPCPGSVFTNVVDPAGTVTFSPLVQHREVGQGWGTWSHGYSGDVYYVTGSSLTMTLPADTVAFYFYAEPNFSIKDITATAQDGTTSGPIPVSASSGARYFGFYATGGAAIATITVNLQVVPEPPFFFGRGFAVGEFGIAIRRNLPPDCSDVAANPDRLWPPNHKLRTVTLTGATDPDGDTPTLTITGVTQDEPVRITENGDASPDAVAGPASNQVSLRAERRGDGDGRVYRIAFAAAGFAVLLVVSAATLVM
jgi:hypothetical protein